MIKHKLLPGTVVLLICALSLGAQQPALTPSVRTALDHISADSLRGHLSFIASDALEGRNTPSRGLDIAAEYIAAQFRRAGLEPVGDDGYFQTANWLVADRNMADFEFHLKAGSQEISVAGDQVSFNFNQSLTLAPTVLVKVDFKDVAALDALTSAQVEGKVVLTEIPDARCQGHAQMADANRAQNEFISKVNALKPALVVSIDRHHATGLGAAIVRPIDPENRGGGGGRPNAPS